MNGKMIGIIAFIVTEVLVILCAIAVIIGFYKEIDVSIPIGGVLTLQGTVFATVWAGVATKNFRKNQ